MSDKDLVIVVGAGASVAIGIPSVEQLTQSCMDELPEVRRKGVSFGGHPSETQSGRTFRLADALAAGLRSSYNSFDFERLLHAVEELEAFLVSREDLTADDDLRPIIESFTDIAQRYQCIADPVLMRQARRAIVRHLHRRMSYRQPPSGTDEYEAFKQLENIVKTLAKSHRLVVIDFNYDDIFDHMDVKWADGFVEEDCDPSVARFSPKKWIEQAADRDAHLLMHMHGSVRFGQFPRSRAFAQGDRNERRLDEPARYPSSDEALRSLERSTLTNTVVDGQILEASAIISGLNKGSKLVHNARPYGYYYATVMNVLPQSEKLAIFGYGWRDHHVNTWIRECISVAANKLQTAIVMRNDNTQLAKGGPVRRHVGALFRAADSESHLDAFLSKSNEFHTDHLFAVGSGFPLKVNVERDIDIARDVTAFFSQTQMNPPELAPPTSLPIVTGETPGIDSASIRERDDTYLRKRRSE